jgi:hypothetical protein
MIDTIHHCARGEAISTATLTLAMPVKPGECWTAKAVRHFPRRARWLITASGQETDIPASVTCVYAVTWGLGALSALNAFRAKGSRFAV